MKNLALDAGTLPDFDAFSQSVTQTIEKCKSEHRKEILRLVAPNFHGFGGIQLSAV